MNLLDLIARAKSLYSTITDPAAGIFAKVKAVIDFLEYVKPLFSGPAPMFAGDDVPASAEEAIANLEALAGEGVGAVEGDGRIIKAVLALLVKFLPLLI